MQRVVSFRFYSYPNLLNPINNTSYGGGLLNSPSTNSRMRPRNTNNGGGLTSQPVDEVPNEPRPRGGVLQRPRDVHARVRRHLGERHGVAVQVECESKL
jgi:hypothetical protein